MEELVGGRRRPDVDRPLVRIGRLAVEAHHVPPRRDDQHSIGTSGLRSVHDHAAVSWILHDESCHAPPSQYNCGGASAEHGHGAAASSSQNRVTKVASSHEK
jgi:hypothetical protein